MNRRVALLALTVAGGLLALPAAAILSTVAPMYVGAAPAAAAESCDQLDVDPVGGWDTEQTTNAATIVAVGQSLKVPARGFLVAIMTAIQESGLRNLDYGDRDSLGLFQQRPSQGWGTPAEVRDPVYASTRFYRGLLAVDGWESMRLTEAAQAVQRSAFPEAYARWEPDARMLLAQLGGAVVDTCPTAPPATSGTWVRPLAHYRISDTYQGGYRSTGGHSGIDLAAPVGTVIVAVGAGRVVSAERAGAYGNLTCVDHGKAVTCYAHQSAIHVRPGQTVVAGQPIGAVGVTGNTTGPHLHFEVRLGGVPVDPAPWMTERGVPL